RDLSKHAEPHLGVPIFQLETANQPAYFLLGGSCGDRLYVATHSQSLKQHIREALELPCSGGCLFLSDTGSFGTAYKLVQADRHRLPQDRKSTRLNSSHGSNSYAVFCLEKKIISMLHL